MSLLNAKINALKGKTTIHVRGKMVIASKAKFCGFAPIKHFGKHMPAQRNA